MSSASSGGCVFTVLLLRHDSPRQFIAGRPGAARRFGRVRRRIEHVRQAIQGEGVLPGHVQDVTRVDDQRRPLGDVR